MNLNLDNFPDSPYAAELRRGVSGLRFQRALEIEYSAAHLQRVRLRVRIWFALTAILATLFAIDAVRRTGPSSVLSILHMGLLVPCTLTLVWLVSGRQYQRYFMPAARVLVTLFCVLIAVFIANGLADGRFEQLAGLAVNLIGVFFFAGLMFRQALLTTAFMVVTFFAAAVAVHLPTELLVKSMVVVVLTAAIGAVVYHDVEQSYRTAFLEGALVKQLAARDGLSGLMNRRAFDEHLFRVWQHALRDQRSIAILMIDVDHFKQFNDRFGHQAGDEALRQVANAIQGFARRPLDLAARYGGEEFAVILYDLELPHVRDLAERLRHSIAMLHLEAVDGDVAAGKEVTVSVGVGVAAPTLGRTPQGAVQLADEALYEAKQTGRNRVVVKGSEEYKLLHTGGFKTPRAFRRGR